MALSNSIAAYDDCFAHFDRAQAAENGIRILMSTESEANYLRFRLNQARALERKESCRIYDRTDPLYGKSENDCFRISVMRSAEGETGFWVYIRKWHQQFDAVEEL